MIREFMKPLPVNGDRQAQFRASSSAQGHTCMCEVVQHPYLVNVASLFRAYVTRGCAYNTTTQLNLLSRKGYASQVCLCASYLSVCGKLPHLHLYTRLSQWN